MIFEFSKYVKIITSNGVNNLFGVSNIMCASSRNILFRFKLNIVVSDHVFQ